MSTDTWATNAAFTSRHGIAFPLLSDWPEYAAIQAFGVAASGGQVARRVSFVYKRTGVITAVVAVDDGRTHVARVLDAAKGEATTAGGS